MSGERIGNHVVWGRVGEVGDFEQSLGRRTIGWDGSSVQLLKGYHMEEGFHFF